VIRFRETTLEQLSLDHKLEIDALVGSARLTVAIPTSAGRDGFGPDLGLAYNNGAGNSPFGFGWTLSGVPSIGLDATRRLPTYRDDEDRYMYAGGEELAPTRRLQNGQWMDVVDDRGAFRVYRYRARVERSFQRFEKWVDRASGRTHWRRLDPDGGVSVFGRALDGSTRIADPSDPDRTVFQWLLEAQFDAKGNAVRLAYKPEDGAGVSASASFESGRVGPGAVFPQRYLKRILYGNSTPQDPDTALGAGNIWHFEVVFDYGEHGSDVAPTYLETRPWSVRDDPYSHRRAGFEVRTWRLCRRILMAHRFPELGPGSLIVGATELTHRADPAGSVLRRVLYRGYRTDLALGGRSELTLPPLDFDYSDSLPALSFEPAEPADNAPVGIDGVTYRLVDLRSEGLPGILSDFGGGWYYKENLGDGHFGMLTPTSELPTTSLAAFTLEDFNGDGNLDLVGFEGREAGYYERQREVGRWDGFRPFEHLPRVDFANARVQHLDFNGDGHPDLVVDRDDRLVWYPSEGATGFAAAVEISKPTSATSGSPSCIQDAATRTFFADMTGDGLLDLVHIGNGLVEYWPSLGNGRFGAPVVMEGAPQLDDSGAFDPERLRFADLDGSGTADLIALGRGEVRYWINQGGNRFGPEVRLQGLPFIDRLSAVQIFDFLGDGTTCLVWSSGSPTLEGRAMQFLRLTRGLPPRLLIGVANGIGRRTRLSYRSSARDYLRDRESGRSWRSLMPNHRMVVATVEGLDDVGGARTVGRYEYHDGVFDDLNRQLVGFGMVDFFDADDPQSAGAPPDPDACPPTLTRTWFLSGAADDFVSRAVDFYASDPLVVHLPAVQIDGIAGLSTEEQLDAFRVLAGRPWREEVYLLGSDGSRSAHPLRTSEFAQRIRSLQPAREKQGAVFAFYGSESLRYDYQQAPDDPRITHDVVLDASPYGDAQNAASIAYPRRPAVATIRDEQRQLLVELVVSAAVDFDTPQRYEVGIATDNRRYALLALDPGPEGVFRFDALHQQVQAALADPLPYFADPPGPGSTPRARLLHYARKRYCDPLSPDPLDPGVVGAVTLLRHIEQAVLPEDAVAAAYDGRVTNVMLSGEGHCTLSDGFWWASGEGYRYSDAGTFYRVAAEQAPGAGQEVVEFDPHFLLVTGVQDGFGSRIEGAIDYQTLAAFQIKDANDNVAEVRYDALGAAFVSGVRGRQLGADGAGHEVGSDALAAYAAPAATTAADVLANPALFLQGAERFVFHDLAAWARGDGPPRTVLLEREHYLHDGERPAPSPTIIRVTLAYFDGFGRPIQSKRRVDAGPAITRDGAGAIVMDGNGTPLLTDSVERWLTSGFDVYNNKGWAVRKFEPFFTTRPDFELDESIRRYGVATRHCYDAAGRSIRREYPNGSFSTTTFSPWALVEADATDNVVGSDYESERLPLAANDPERQALAQAQLHAATPTIIETDARGRAVRVRELGDGGVERVTRTELNDAGSTARVLDPRDIVALAYRYDMLGRIVRERGVDAGDRWYLRDAGGRLVHQWDGRGTHTTRAYDTAGRLISVTVQELNAGPRVVERITYGDDPMIADAKLRNSLGRVVEHLDEAGRITFDRYHLMGSLLDSRRTLLALYDAPVDWSDPTVVALDGVTHRVITEIDALERIMRQDLPDGTTREYAYALHGHVAESRLSTDDGVINRAVVVNEISHDARGQRARFVLGNGVETRYDYEPRTSRLERLHVRGTEGAHRDYLDIEYTCDPVGNITRWIDHVQDPGAAIPLCQGLTVTSACDFTYDAFYQLTTASGRVHQALLPSDVWAGPAEPGVFKGTRHLTLNNGAAVERYTRTYTYDLSGNLQRTRHDGTSGQWNTDVWTSPTSNRSLPAEMPGGGLVVDPETWFDANGNTIRMPHLRSLTWNHANRLIAAVVIDRSGAGERNDAEYYTHDGDGLRVRRVSERLIGPGVVEVTDTVYFEGCEIRRVSSSGVTRLLRRTSHVTDGAVRVATLHQWSVDAAAAETDDVTRKKLHYVLGNHLGSICLELDDAAQVISYEEYFPYGGTSFIAGADLREVSLKEYRYSGKLRDDVTGFYHFPFREYTPWIAHWLTPDPAGSDDGLNLYAFVHGNPICLVDADGLAADGFKVEINTIDALPPELQRRLAADPALRARYERNDLYFVPKKGGGYDELSRAQRDEFIRSENKSGRKVRLNLVRDNTKGSRPQPSREGGGGSREQVDEILNSLDDVFKAIRDVTETPLPSGAKGTAGTQDDNAGGGAKKGTAHPADGSSGTGKTGDGRTGETGSNGTATTGTGPGAGEKGQGVGGGGKDAPTGGSTAGAGPGTGGARGRGTAIDTGATTGTGPGDEQGDKEGLDTGTGDDESDVPVPPAGYVLGENGIPYSPNLPPPDPSAKDEGPVSAKPSSQRGTSGSDERGHVGSDRGGSVRPPGTVGGGGGDGAHKPGEVGKKPGHTETALEIATRWAGYLNLVFSKGEADGESGGIPGALGLLGLKGAAIQVLFIIATVVSTITMVASIVRSISMATIRQAIPRLLGIVRNPIAALRGVWTAARGFAGETADAVRWLMSWGRRAFQRGNLSGFFRLGGRWRGPGQILKELFWEGRAWESIRAWRNSSSFWFKPRLFGTGAEYSWEHIVTQNFGRRFPAIEPFVNSFTNNFLRLPTATNGWMSNILARKAQFYSGAVTALQRSFQGGWSWAKSFIVDPDAELEAARGR
jgi:RHS repeat-associated protein